MSDERGAIETPAALPTAAPHSPRMRTLLICDLADSTALVERLGDGPASELIRRHDRVARDLLQRFRGREIDKTDGFLLLFDRPVEAVGFALAYQRALHSLGRDAQQTLRARVGIHVGEVVLWENSAAEIAAGAKPVEVEGLAKPVVARLMALALPGQIVLSGVAFTIAQRAEKELEASAPLRWLTHGRYHFKGVPAPMLVHEVGEAGFAPLQAPPSSAKAVRDVPLWRKPGVLALEVIAVIAAIAIPLTLSLRAPPAIAFGERDWVVMGELRNLTGETLLDDSLETAFRISLEQSRHVNVLPDLKLRDALARMQRPADTTIDRAVASEIALREGARAVIMPTVAEVGGRVRVSAEVVDPSTQTTVYAESADGLGAVSTLGSIDRVTHELRAKLGEALAAIEQDSAPLPHVASANLDALRAYALGYDAYLNAEFKAARALYGQALELDPDFSQARIGIARLHLTASENAEARRELSRALAASDRLPARERLYGEALQAVLEHEPDYLERWQALISVYPDFFPSYYNYALFGWEAENEYTRTIEIGRGGLDQKNPAFGVLHYLLGTLELGREDYDAALKHLERARAVDGDASRRVWIAAYAAQRRFAEAETAASEVRKFGLPGNDIGRHLALASLSVDREGPDKAVALLRAAIPEAKAAGQVHAALLDTASLALRELTADLNFKADLSRSLAARIARAQDEDLSERPHLAFDLAWLATLSARAGDEQSASEAILVAERLCEGSHYPVAAQLVAAARVQLHLSRGDIPAARKVLNQALGQGGALIATRVVEIELLIAERRLDDAAAALEQLAGLRGRAWVEPGSRLVLQPRNVAETNLAWLRGAELALQMGDQAAAREKLRRFEATWTAAAQPDAVRDRAFRIRAATVR